jgi:hypothetical protein
VHGRSSIAAGHIGSRVLGLEVLAADATDDRPGVVFIQEPYRRDYGGIDAVFTDTCGNLLNLHQD